MLESLTAILDPELRLLIDRRVDAMLRQIAYLRTQDNSPRVVWNRWSLEQLQAICILNSFYQLVLAPLASPNATHPSSGLVHSVPVRYGSGLRFDAQTARQTAAARREFLHVTSRLGVPLPALRAAQADELLFALAQEPSGDDEE
jgi:hypothetical protein